MRRPHALACSSYILFASQHKDVCQIVTRNRHSAEISAYLRAHGAPDVVIRHVQKVRILLDLHEATLCQTACCHAAHPHAAHADPERGRGEVTGDMDRGRSAREKETAM
eukprot:5197833-Pleurochrysis_carterae.AAC.1